MTNTNFIIPRDGYLTFDALTMKQFIKDRLNDNRVFTDQNYEGSYISTINEIISYVFHGLLYYLNRTSTESMFSETQIYENMNRIVKLLDYNPLGYQAPVVTFSLSGNKFIDNGIYTIPRYSFVSTGNIKYSLNEDIVFTKKIEGEDEILDNNISQKLLYQGTYVEYPLHDALGDTNEIVFLTPGENVLIDHFNIDVYVFEKDKQKWHKWERVTTLYLENSDARAYEIRFNENKQYEIKFGNDINGKKLKLGDKVSIYYLHTLGKDGEIGSYNIKYQDIKLFASSRFNNILNDITPQHPYISTDIANNLSLSNTNNSTYAQEEESVDSIRTNAPGIFRSQYRVVTENDYDNFIKSNFANLIHDIKTVNNWTYLTKQLKYYYEEIGLKDPNTISNILYNQVNFADSCNFNNVYITVAPKTISNIRSTMPVLTPAQKELLINSLKPVKTLTTEVVIIDPVYIAIDLGLSGYDYNDEFELVLVKDPNSRRDNNPLILAASNIFLEYFKPSNIRLGHNIDVKYLTTQLLSIPGVKNIFVRLIKDPSVKYLGLSLIAWNPVYPTDNKIINEGLSFEYFKYPFLNMYEKFKNKITIQTQNENIFNDIEY